MVVEKDPCACASLAVYEFYIMSCEIFYAPDVLGVSRENHEPLHPVYKVYKTDASACDIFLNVRNVVLACFLV